MIEDVLESITKNRSYYHFSVIEGMGMEIQREHYLAELRLREKNGMVKIITGPRRVGKSYLLFRLFYRDLIARGVDPSHIICVALDDIENEGLRERRLLYDYVKSRIRDNDAYYVFLDEIQFVDGFVDTVNGLLHIENLDVYVTGSNSRLLSSDILTEFRGRGDEVRVYPLSFREFCSVFEGTSEEAWETYIVYGGMPAVALMRDDRQKTNYLSRLFRETYLRDLTERNKIRRHDDFAELIRVLASAVGSLTNPSKLQRTFQSLKKSTITDKTIREYIDALKDAFLIDTAIRYDIKGKRYIGTPVKHYFTDIGIRNAVLSYRQPEETHLMENVIFNELKIRGYEVDIGVVEKRAAAGAERTRLEIDFIARLGSAKYYIQSAFSMDEEMKRRQEERPLLAVNDSFKKIIVTGRNQKLWRNEQGITTIGVREFLLEEKSLEL